MSVSDMRCLTSNDLLSANPQHAFAPESIIIVLMLVYLLVCHVGMLTKIVQKSKVSIVRRNEGLLYPEAVQKYVSISTAEITEAPQACWHLGWSLS